ncbi:SDR family NAD(P)-dependent oxidoreductase [Actibacterium sp. 188UL27-1]|uniref:SDR family NAD(P)-dependent oxidoreductase n=1 Tax=Actibacterium sp. 188UL27-1 TaxID=2786961 RepID=UPI00195F0B63|nr:SDR family NAD(P)-dependent oxidoreductase [Actibacterium sp. 188UL27-1]MBM7066903.1 SDR family NAD(P)-dependent oxidoreductase [Actibacterium sp. 188UL27-1]
MTVLITGANRGIGHALATRYAQRGLVIGTYRTAPPDDTPETLSWHQLDVAQPQSQAALCHKLDGHPIELLICNAGIYLDKGENLADGYPVDQWEQSFASNVTGVFLTVQNLLPNLQVAGTAKIAIISSQMASSTRAPGGSYIYRASKAAALNLGRNLATDLKGLDIAVGIYHPGWVRTDMGGDSAAISTDEAADGLVNRFDALSLGTTGCFETWDGRPHDY